MGNVQTIRMRILGVPVSIRNMTTAVSDLIDWATHPERPRHVFFRDVHGIMRAYDDNSLMRLHENADLVLPDGFPLVFIGHLRGFRKEIGRTPGADVMEAVCRASLKLELTHYFFGGKPGVAEKMSDNLRAIMPELRVAGIYSPPMRDYLIGSPLSPDEKQEIRLINESGADFVWVGISTPKQEIWMSRAAPHLRKGVMLGVGAAFDFHAGLIGRAPKIMRQLGLEWLFRFAMEPRRLWHRYLVLAPRFLILCTLNGFRK